MGCGTPNPCIIIHPLWLAHLELERLLVDVVAAVGDDDEGVHGALLRPRDPRAEVAHARQEGPAHARLARHAHGPLAVVALDQEAGGLVLWAIYKSMCKGLREWARVKRVQPRVWLRARRFVWVGGVGGVG